VYQAVLTIIYKEIENEERRTATDTFSWFEIFQQLINALRYRLTIWHKTQRQHPTLPSSLRLLIKHKHYL
jgi:hypothetical protein